jgi:hypothetical protein
VLRQSDYRDYRDYGVGSAGIRLIEMPGFFICIVLASRTEGIALDLVEVSMGRLYECMGP